MHDHYINTQTFEVLHAVKIDHGNLNALHDFIKRNCSLGTATHLAAYADNVRLVIPPSAYCILNERHYLTWSKDKGFKTIHEEEFHDKYVHAVGVDALADLISHAIGVFNDASGQLAFMKIDVANNAIHVELEKNTNA